MEDVAILVFGSSVCLNWCRDAVSLLAGWLCLYQMAGGVGVGELGCFLEIEDHM